MSFKTLPSVLKSLTYSFYSGKNYYFDKSNNLIKRRFEYVDELFIEFYIKNLFLLELREFIKIVKTFNKFHLINYNYEDVLERVEFNRDISYFKLQYKFNKLFINSNYFINNKLKELLQDKYYNYWFYSFQNCKIDNKYFDIDIDEKRKEIFKKEHTIYNTSYINWSIVPEAFQDEYNNNLIDELTNNLLDNIDEEYDSE